MKKIYLLLPILLFASCGSNEDENENPTSNNAENSDPVLVTKMVSEGETSIFSYNGTKLTQSKNITTGSTSNVTYTGDLITKIIDIDAISTTTTIYNYDNNGRLIKSTSFYTSSMPTSTTENTYTYTSSTTVKIVTTMTTAGISGSKVYTKNASLNADGSLKSWNETVVQQNGSAGTGVLQNVIYDTRNKPFKNVTGYLKLMDSEDENGSVNNVLDYNNVINYSAGGEWTIFKSTYEYNSSNYPTKNTISILRRMVQLYQVLTSQLMSIIIYR